jgi:bifunctional polynucleotide phosphatase/kinase
MEISIATIKKTGKIAAFDFDHTLVKPKNNKTFPSDVNDWTYNFTPDIIKNKIKSLHDEGFDIVIFSNQSKPWKITQIKNVILDINIPISYVIAIDKINYKPNTIIFDTFISNTGINVNHSESFYVGDALDSKLHFSDSDMLFARNINLKVYSPEEYFISPVVIVNDIDVQIYITRSLDKIPIVNGDEIIIMVGYPGSGKSTIAKAIMEREKGKYIILSKDNKLTDAKIIKSINTQPGSFIVDNTNPSEKRNQYINPTKPYRIIYVSTDFDESYRRNMLRETPVPKIAYHMFKKNFVMPENAIII